MRNIHGEADVIIVDQQVDLVDRGVNNICVVLYLRQHHPYPAVTVQRVTETCPNSDMKFGWQEWQRQTYVLPPS